MAPTLDVNVNPRGAVAGAAAAESALDRLKFAATSTQASMTKLTATGDRMGLAFKALTASFVVGGILKASDAYITIQNRLKLVTASQEQLADAYKKVYDLAQETRGPLEGTAKFYAQVSLNARQLGLDQEELIGVTRTLNQVIALTGQSAEASNNALIQLQQAMGAGALRGDELRSIMEQLPLLAQIIADKMKIPVGRLKEFGEQGAISAKIVVQALQASSEQISEAFSKTSFTFGQAITIIHNGIINLIGSINESTGIFTGFNKALAYTGLLLSRAGPYVLTVASAFGAWKALSLVSWLAATNTTLIRIVGSAILMTGTISNLGRMFITLRTAIMATTTAMITFVMSNPITALIQGVIILVTLLYTFRDSIIVNTETGATMGDVFTAAFRGIGMAITWVIQSVVALSTALGLTRVNVSAVFSAIGTAVSTVFQYITATVNYIIQFAAMLGITGANIAATFSAIGGIFTWLGNGILGLIDLIVRFVNNLLGLKTNAVDLGNIMGSVFMFIGDVARGMVGIVVGGVRAAVFAISEFINNIAIDIATAVNWVVAGVETIVNEVIGYLNQLLAILGQVATIGPQSFGRITINGSTMSATEYFNGIKDAFKTGLTDSSTLNGWSGSVNKGVRDASSNYWNNSLSELGKGSAASAGTKASTDAVAKTVADGANSTTGAVNNGASATVSAIGSLGSGLSQIAGAVAAVGSSGGGGGGHQDSMDRGGLAAMFSKISISTNRSLTGAEAATAQQLGSMAADAFSKGLISSEQLTHFKALASATGVTLPARGIGVTTMGNQLQGTGLSGGFATTVAGNFMNSFNGPSVSALGYSLQELTAIMKKYVAPTSNPISVNTSAIKTLTGSMNMMTTGMSALTGEMQKAVYDMLDLARQNVSPLYGPTIRDSIASYYSGLQGFAKGGSMYRVGGSGGPDSKVVPVRLSPNEMVHFTPRGQQGGGAVIHIHNSNTVVAANPQEFRSARAEIDNVYTSASRRALRRSGILS